MTKPVVTGPTPAPSPSPPERTRAWSASTRTRQTPPNSNDAAAVPLEAIMQGATTLPILHNGDVYTLRVTRYGKLILTK